MKTGSQGTFVISWSQTEIDGLAPAPMEILAVGATWRWTGVPVRVDGPQAVFVLDGAEGATEVRRRAARTVRRLIGVAVGSQDASSDDDDAPIDMPDQSFIVTDGYQTHTITVINVPDTGAMLLMLVGGLPPPDRDLWVTRTTLDKGQYPRRHVSGGVICFTPGTRLATPKGLVLIQNLRPGDLIQTRDNGPQPVLWTGHRRMSGARLCAMPHLRPIRFRAGALGVHRPDIDLLVSPQHRMLVRGPAARSLFNTAEVLVAAENLINDHTILVDYTLREVTYVHVLLENHNVIWANGLETESFHPANTSLDMMEPVQRRGLLSIFPDLAQNPQAYGDYARRNLSKSEAAILRHDMAARN